MGIARLLHKEACMCKDFLQAGDILLRGFPYDNIFHDIPGWFYTL
jgi:hypothetical protein